MVKWMVTVYSAMSSKTIYFEIDYFSHYISRSRILPLIWLGNSWLSLLLLGACFYGASITEKDFQTLPRPSIK